MTLKKSLLLLLFLTISIYAKESIGLIDQYHDDLCTALIHTSNSIDNYFIEEDRGTSRSRTSAQLSSSFAIENHQKLEKDIRFRLRLNLPKIQKNLRLIFEDENNDNALYDGTTLNDKNFDTKRYYLRIEYFNFMKYKLNMVAASGLRIRQGNLVPYLNLRSRYDAYQGERLKSEFFNRFRFYSDGEIENVFEFNSLYSIDPSLYAIWRNQLDYNNDDAYENVVHDLSLVNLLDDKRQISTGVGITNQLKNFKNLYVEYYHLHTLYHHVFYKNWLYYQLAPSVLWRESNNLQISYRFMVKFGILFN